MKTRLPEALLPAAITLLLWTSEAQARTWVVAADGSGDFLLLSEACEAAALGDTVNIMPGSYVEEEHDEWGEPPLTISSKTLHIRGIADKPTTVSITARILLQYSEIDLQCLSLSNTPNPLRIEGGNTRIQACVFQDNDGPGRAGVLECVYDAVVLIEDCQFLRNRADGKGGCIYASGPELSIRRCVFAANQSGDTGGALYTRANTTVEESVFYGNVAPDGAAIDLGESCVIRMCTIWANHATAGGETVSIGGPAAIEATIIGGTIGGTALECESDGVFTCCVFWGNEGGIGGGFWDCGLVDYLEADPLFCDPATGDFGLREGSPCLPGGYDGCGRIGASDLGCGIDAVHETSWGSVKSLFRW